jgi:predicted nuclease of restriction endonuclease-like (RecB) superfamily
MRDVFFEMTGSTANLSPSVVKNNNHFGLTEQEVLEQQQANTAELELRLKTPSQDELVDGSDHLDIISGSDTFDLIFTEEEPIMDKYLLSFLKAQQGS